MKSGAQAAREMRGNHKTKPETIKVFQAQPRMVDVVEDETDNLCCFLGAMGQATDVIVKELGLTKHQVTYRLQKGGVRRIDWRNGTSPVYKKVMEIAANKARRTMTAAIQLNGGLVIRDERT